MGFNTMTLSKKIHLIGITLLFASYQVGASELGVPNTFSAGSSAVAADVNDNFTAVKGSVNDNNARLAALEAIILTLQAELAEVKANSALSLDSLVSVETDANGLQTVLFSGVNVQVVNGEHQMLSNGLGNLIVGYNFLASGNIAATEVCSKGGNVDQTSCENVGGIWAKDHRTGSHNLVGGRGNNYSLTGGIVFGRNNTINSRDSSLTGGSFNIASGFNSSVSGGSFNVASGSSSSVSGGEKSNASGINASVSGGMQNFAMGSHSSVSGGGFNRASGEKSSVSGGSANGSVGNYSSINGGAGNLAQGDYSTVSGGQSRSVIDIYDWAAGSLLEDL